MRPQELVEDVLSHAKDPDYKDKTVLFCWVRP